LNLSVQKETAGEVPIPPATQGGKPYPCYRDIACRLAIYNEFEKEARLLAIFHSHVQIISRGKGKSAVAAAAYRAGEHIKNDYDGISHDYTRKGGVVYTEVMLPDHAPNEYANRAVLWNAVEKIEKASNSQLAREIEIALPVELTREQNISLVRDYVKRTFVMIGMCADVCVHDKGDGNPHAHIMLTMRQIDKDGKWGGKQKKEYILDSGGNKIYDPKKRQYKCRSIPSTDWNDQTKADEWRAAWENAANAELERLGFDVHIDRRTYEEQGIEQIPTVHMGVAASQMEKRGIHTERGDMNRIIEITNKHIQQLRARINRLHNWIVEETANNKTPTLADVLDEVFSRQGQSALTRLKNGVDIFNFLHDNEIYSIVDLEIKVKTMQGKVNSVREELKKVERRVGTLEEHIRHSENFKNYRKFKVRYEELYSQYRAARKPTGGGAERKMQKALDAANDYYETHHSELAMFESAEQYLRNVLQERFDPKTLPPITKWREELFVKTAEKDMLYQEYYTLKDETVKVEKIKRSVTDILQSDEPKRVPQKIRGMAL